VYGAHFGDPTLNNRLIETPPGSIQLQYIVAPVLDI